MAGASASLSWVGAGAAHKQKSSTSPRMPGQWAVWDRSQNMSRGPSGFKERGKRGKGIPDIPDIPSWQRLNGKTITECTFCAIQKVSEFYTDPLSLHRKHRPI